MTKIYGDGYLYPVVGVSILPTIRVSNIHSSIQPRSLEFCVKGYFRYNIEHQSYG